MLTDLTCLELLAPARDVTIGTAAIDHGADAVYIGGPGFGARAQAGNSMQDIERLTRYAHRYHARIYLTLNTLLFDDEIEPARRLAWQAYEAGVDALIVQDLGLLEADLPPIQLHASTQCDIRTPEKARFLEHAGFSQLVLARELTLTEIAACRAAMEHARIEFFVHGALCVSYSGQCYLSCAQCARSANRGQCAQPCRLPYSVYDMNHRELARNRHVLSLKDNDQHANLEELVLAGVSSFKIEGRLKEADYVKNITAYYRKHIDALLEKHARDGWQASSLGHTQLRFEPNPEKTFHRGATEYFIHGRQSAIAELDTPKSTGQRIGTVLAVHVQPPCSLEVRSQETLANADGLIYRNRHDEIEGLSINRAESLGPGLWQLFPHDPLERHPDLVPGTVLNRNRDRLFGRELAAQSARRSIPVTLTLGHDAQSLWLQAQAAGEQVTVTHSFVCQPAKDSARALQTLHTQLAKTGETLFDLHTLVLDFAPDQPTPFIPVSVLNGLRREALEQLEAAVAAALPRLVPGPVTADCAAAPELDYRANVTNGLARQFWLAHGADRIDPAFELLTGPQTAGGTELMRCRHCIRSTLGLCPKLVKGDVQKKEQFKQANGGVLKPADLLLVDAKGRKLLAHFDCRACEMTIRAAGDIQTPASAQTLTN